MFATTTCLAFAHLFAREEMRERLLAKLTDDVLFYGATIHAFCVMPHHLHVVARAPETKTMSWFMQRFKSNSAKVLLPHLLPSELRAMAPERGNQGHQMWKVSFRGIPIRTERVFWSTIRYVHLNPVRWGMVSRPEEYAWSSAMLFESCKWREEDGVNGPLRTWFEAGVC